MKMFSNILDVRKDFPAIENYNYLNTASVGLLPKQTISAIKRYLDEERLYGNIYWKEWENKLEQTRSLIAKLIGATEEEIAVVPNTSEGLNIVANGIKWKNKENIVLNDLEFPSNIFPWQNQAKKHNLEIRIAKNVRGKIPLEEYEKHIDDSTRVVAVSWVEFQNGFKHDLKALAELAHAHGAYLVVDGTQSVGMLDIDVKKMNVDFLACACAKWLISPIGTGFLYIRRDLVDEIDATYVGWRSVKDPENFSYRWFELDETARRFEAGSPSFLGIQGLMESLKYIRRIGPRSIERRDLELAEYLVEQFLEIKQLKIVTPLNEDKPQSAIVSFTCRNVEEVYNKLLENRFIVSLRLNAIRVSPHFYNVEQEIENLVNLVKNEIR
ncbi:MAG: aminotransferase class V-fold PLP-dependent enzyme [Candidatus Baldrarchaeota archaeon]